MAKVPKERRAERAAVNAVRALLEAHDHSDLPLDEQMDIRWRFPDVEPETVDTEL